MGYEGIALTVAGSDSSGGAGIQADLKTFAAFNVYGASVITSITAQNTTGVFAVFDIPPEIVGKQFEVVAEDLNIGAVKIGMLSNSEIMIVVAENIKKYRIEKVVLDPVMVAKTGAPLIKDEAIKTLKEVMIPLAYVITPNIPEAEILTGIKISNPMDMKEAAKIIFNMGAKHVLIKGGHLMGYSKVIDILFDGKASYVFQSDKVETKNTHGTGCTLSSAIAAGLAKGKDVYKAVSDAEKYINLAIKEAPKNIGHGFGPLYHNVKI
ncbi:MAG: bifunctional hydroxymethylpyrimidine kinase/phosphomethylpyrimidine kinase [Synergistetes bacterium]|nr:bifunctional hydroxymethylpyrimidine kinase/phosphomethylpyrimidine kinase [Synergistota bacterium]MCX8128335.1 bifunctional hydroxymethylpyrimidine kinase/phosphomethylpyrimidine kinase [Synergistota bacterium]MDW8193006.1 bifunctional hydroxymethylpyrimidine kinase/phosphomethylpyrimidine kinase [Synergistota bacterium]